MYGWWRSSVFNLNIILVDKYLHVISGNFSLHICYPGFLSRIGPGGFFMYVLSNWRDIKCSTYTDGTIHIHTPPHTHINIYIHTYTHIHTHQIRDSKTHVKHITTCIYILAHTHKILYLCGLQLIRYFYLWGSKETSCIHCGEFRGATFTLSGLYHSRISAYVNLCLTYTCFIFKLIHVTFHSFT